MRTLGFLVVALCIALGACEQQPTSPVRARTIDAFEPHLTAGLTPADARRLFGAPDEETGSGLRIYIYQLEGNRELWLGFPGDAPITYAHLKTADGAITDLVLRP